MVLKRVITLFSITVLISLNSCVNQSFITHGYQPILMDSARQTKIIVGASPRLMKVGVAHSFEKNVVLSTMNDFNRYYIDTKAFGLYYKNYPRCIIETGIGLGYVGNNTRYTLRRNYISDDFVKLKINASIISSDYVFTSMFKFPNGIDFIGLSIKTSYNYIVNYNYRVKVTTSDLLHSKGWPDPLNEESFRTSNMFFYTFEPQLIFRSAFANGGSINLGLTIGFIQKAIRHDYSYLQYTDNKIIDKTAYHPIHSNAFMNISYTYAFGKRK